MRRCPRCRVENSLELRLHSRTIGISQNIKRRKSVANFVRSQHITMILQTRMKETMVISYRSLRPAVDKKEEIVRAEKLQVFERGVTHL